MHPMILLALTIPPAAKVLGVAALVYTVLQYILKNVPGVGKYIVGWKSVVLNLTLSILGVVVALPPSQLYTEQTFNTICAVAVTTLSAAGIHGTIQNQAPALLAQKPSDPKPPAS